MNFLTFGVICILIAMISGHRWNLQHHNHQQGVSDNKSKSEYKYGVKDVNTGTKKQQWEYRDGNQVKNNSKYEYKYGVKDVNTGDIKQQWEYRDGDQVKGGYSFKEADGFIRVVEYSVDGQSGFKAVVKRIDPSKYFATQSYNHHQHIAYNGNHIHHDAHGNGKSFVNVVRY